MPEECASGLNERKLLLYNLVARSRIPGRFGLSSAHRPYSLGHGKSLSPSWQLHHTGLQKMLRRPTDPAIAMEPHKEVSSPNESLSAAFGQGGGRGGHGRDSGLGRGGIPATLLPRLMREIKRCIWRIPRSWIGTDAAGHFRSHRH